MPTSPTCFWSRSTISCWSVNKRYCPRIFTLYSDNINPPSIINNPILQRVRARRSFCCSLQAINLISRTTISQSLEERESTGGRSNRSISECERNCILCELTVLLLITEFWERCFLILIGSLSSTLPLKRKAFSTLYLFTNSWVLNLLLWSRISSFHFSLLFRWGLHCWKSESGRGCWDFARTLHLCSSSSF